MRLSLLGLIGVSSLLLVSAASATTLISPSVANIGGTVRVDNTGVYFSNVTAPGPNSGSFAGTTGVTINPLVGPPYSGSTDMVKFATFTNPSGDIYFDLTQINPGIGKASACGDNTVGNVCTPVFTIGGNTVVSPFTLSQVAPGQVSISLSLSGIAYTGTSTDGYSVAPFSFTSQNTMPGTITDILRDAESSTGFTNSFSATISASAVPEPASCLLLGAGLVAAGVAARRKRSA